MKRRILSIIMVLTLCLGLAPGIWALEPADENWTDGLAEAPAGWSESEDGNTITITTPEALAWLAVLVNDETITRVEDNPTFGKTVVLGSDLDLGGKNWVPIGNGKLVKHTINAFVGNFDGNGHTISHLTIDDADGGDSIGLFGNIYLNNAGFIRNVTVENAAITTNTFTGSGYIGVLAGQVLGAGSVSDCTASGTIHCREACINTFAGGMFGFLNPTTGFVDQVYLTVDRCFADVEITGAPMYAGGFVGYLGSCGEVVNCGSIGDVTVTEPYHDMPYVGGFIGSFETMNGSVSVKNCYATGNVSLTSGSAGDDMICAGGFLGGIDTPEKTASIQGCMSSGNVTVTASENIDMVLVGGFIGNGAQLPILRIANSYSTGDVMAANGTYVLCGGFLGYSASTAENCYSSGNVISQNGATYSWAFGFSGWTVSGASFTNCYALGASMNGGTHTANFLNGSHSLDHCFYYADMELEGTNVSNQAVTALSKDAIINGTAFSGFDRDFWQIYTGSIPILAGIPDEVEKTNKPVYLPKTVTFDSQGGSAVDSQSVAIHEKITQPADPTRTGFIFAGWYREADCVTAWDFAVDTVEADMILYAKWESVSYTVSFDSQGGTNVAAVQVNHGASVPEPADPEKAGCRFEGWYTDAAGTSAYDFNGAVTGPLTLYAKWTLNQHAISFDSQGGSAVAPVQADYGTKLTRPADPEREGYAFAGWYREADCVTAWDFAVDTVEADMILYAKWENVSYIVSFDSQGGTNVAAVQVNHGASVPEPADPEKAGYTFEGWYTDAAGTSAYDFSGAVTRPLTLYAKWTLNQHAILFDSQGGSAVAPVQADYGTKLTRPADPEREGYAFAGWYREADCVTAWDFAVDTVESDMILYAKWENVSYTVSFDSQGGTNVAAVQVNHGASVPEPADPEKDGFIFGGWYADEAWNTAYDFHSAVTGPLTLHAKWLKILVDPPAGEGDTRYQLVMAEGISELPAGLIGKYDSTGDLEEALKLEITKAAGETSEENIAVYDVALLVSTDGGTTWIAATKENFPEGGLTVTLPYPDGTNSNYSFTVAHMFTTDDFDKIPGTVETPTVTNTSAGIRFTVTGLSPVSVGWKEPVHSSGSGGSWSPSAYSITVEKPAYGKVASDRINAVSGGTVTLTVTPDTGYMLDKLIVTDSEGNEIKLSDKGDGKYTFIMPGRAVMVKATFADKTPETCHGGPDCPSMGFTDLEAGAWYHEAMDEILKNHLMSGYKNGTFGPNDMLSRAQLVQILFNKAGKPAVNDQLLYHDIAADGWYADAVRWAAGQGIVEGYGNGTFGPNDPITREQLAVMLWRYAGRPAAVKKTLEFLDTDRISDYAVEALQWAVEQGIIQGKGNGILDPKGKATRAEAAAMLAQFLKQ